MNISVVIPDHNDLKISSLIESIDIGGGVENSLELVIVLNNPTAQLIQVIQQIKAKYNAYYKFKIININKCNLGLAYNVGVKNSSYEYILFLDSDLVCEKGAIQLMIDAIKNGEYHIAKGKVLFNRKGILSTIISRVRYITTTDTVEPYIPVILINKKLFELLNDGYMFAVDTVWCSDSDFANRVMNKKLPICYVDAFFTHPAISLRKDIKDAFFYGLGKGIRVKRTKENWNPLNEIVCMVKSGKAKSLTFIELCYLFLWELLIQIGCGLQLVIPNSFILKNTLNFTHIHTRRE